MTMCLCVCARRALHHRNMGNLIGKFSADGSLIIIPGILGARLLFRVVWVICQDSSWRIRDFAQHTAAAAAAVVWLYGLLNNNFATIPNMPVAVWACLGYGKYGLLWWKTEHRHRDLKTTRLKKNSAGDLYEKTTLELTNSANALENCIIRLYT